ncbi:MAG: TatD family hydrolase [Muribaculaceae bacterium]|nr:TatD family hydrolase [Muribaculaceae bacterium]
MTRPLDTFTDIHTHTPGKARSIYSLSPGETPDSVPDAEGMAFSAGIHPWDTEDPDLYRRLDTVRAMAADPRVVAIGECGLDALRGAPLDLQEEIFIKQALIAEECGKPLIIHCVRATERLLRLHSTLRPRSLWIIHGFRGKPQTAAQLTRKGIALSLGPLHNHDVPHTIPTHMLYHETD